MVEGIRQGDIPGVQLRVRQPLAAPIPEIWSWLEGRDLWSAWLCDRFELGERDDEVRWISDGPQSETPVETPVDTAVEIVTIVRSEPPLLLEAVLRRSEWDQATRVLFEVGRGPSGNAEVGELSILHRHFERLPLSQGLTIWEHYRRRWRHAAEQLSRVIAEQTAT